MRKEPVQQYIGFNVHGNEYMLPILKVREIITMPLITALPQLPHYVKGVTNLRGSVIPIVNLKTLLNSGEEDSVGNTVIVLTTGKVVFGIIVDGITGVIKIDNAKIEPPESFFNSNIDRIEGIAKLDNKLIVLLDTKKLLPLNDISLMEDTILNVSEVNDGENVEVLKEINTLGGKVTVNELYNAKEYFGDKIDENDPRQKVFEKIIMLIDALSSHDYNTIERITSDLVNETESSLFKEIGKITRNLHDSLEEFKTAVDSGLDKLTNDDVPNAVDKLEFVISKTEDAANKTVAVVERYFEESDEFWRCIQKVSGNQDDIQYLKSFKDSLDGDMTTIITAQQFQDITGQTIRKVINLVHKVEVELVRIITNFGMPMKIDSEKVLLKVESLQYDTADIAGNGVQKVTQSDVESLLQDYGF
jgi:chemotaxis protein CheZ